MHRKEYIVASLVFIVLCLSIFNTQHSKWVYDSTISADTGFFLEMTENIANGNGPVSSIHAAMNNLFRNKVLSLSADELCTMELGRETEEFRRVSDSHKYYITYLIAPLAKIFDVRAVLYMGQAAGFVLMLYLVYRLLRREQVPIALSWLFVGVVFVHPAWSQAVSGQLYVERYFIPLGMLFLYFLHQKEKNVVIPLYISAILIALISERSSMVLGGYVVGYIILMWTSLKQDHKKHLMLIAAALIAFSVYEISILSNIHYQKSAFWPDSFEGLMYRLQNQVFFDKLMTFLLFSILFLGIFAVLEWKLLLLALAMMIPNIFGNVGGAEKTAYLTHYHTLYFPFLVFAATVGYAKLVNRVSIAQARFVVLPLTLVMMLFSMLVSPYGRTVSFNNMINENALLKDLRILPDLFDRGSSLSKYVQRFDEIKDVIPEGSVVTSPERVQAMLHNHVVNYYYPMGLDIANYAVLYISRREGKEEYGGAISYKGQEELKKMNTCLHERMVRAGYDFENKIVINSYAIIRRVPYSTN